MSEYKPVEEKDQKETKKDKQTPSIGRLKCEPPGVETGCCGSSKPHPPPFVDSFVYSSEEKEDIIKVQKVVLTYNPFSGNGRGKREFTVAMNVFKKANVEVKVIQTEYARHATKLANEFDFTGFDAFVVIGGDGTFHEFITGLMERKDSKLIPIGLIAGGTGNSVLTSLGMLDTVKATEAIIKGSKRKVDLGKVSHTDGVTYMFNLLGWGLGVDANVTAESCRCCGPARYNCGALVQICKGTERTAHIEIDGEVMEKKYSIIMVQNNQHGGSNLRLAPYAHINDGLLDVIFLEQRPRCRILKLFDELKREGSHVYFEEVDYRRFKKMVITTKSNNLLNIDGENRDSTPCTIEVMPSVIEIFAPFNPPKSK